MGALAKAGAAVVLVVLWVPVKVLGVWDDICLRYDADELDEGA